MTHRRKPRKPTNPLTTPASLCGLAVIAVFLGLAFATQPPAPRPEARKVKVELTLEQVRRLNAMFESAAREDRAERAILKSPVAQIPPRPRDATRSPLLPPELRDIVWEAATAEGIDPHLFASLIRAESGGKLYPGRSKKGACGIGQFMPITRKEMNLKDCDDPRESARASAGYIRKQLARFDDYTIVFVAYNWGQGRTARWLSRGGKWSELPEETQRYVLQIVVNAAVARRGTQLAME